MKTSRIVTTVDSHTCGEPTRVVTAGIPPVPGESMAAKKQYLEKHHDGLRTLLVREPRGHNDMVGAVLTEPVTPGAVCGIVFFNGGGFLGMCGHGTIGAVTSLLETGVLPWPKGTSMELLLDTAAGPIPCRAEVKDGKVRRVTFRNVPSFLEASGVEVNIPGIGTVKADISFGGSFFGIVEADDMGMRVEPAALYRLLEVGGAIRRALNGRVEPVHPERPNLKGVELVAIYGPPGGAEASARNIVVFGAGQSDRSPCGTGTCARMAQLHARGRLRTGEEYVSESILGTLFRGRIVGETTVGGRAAVIPEVTGEAYLTGFHQFVVDPRDPLADGFRLGPG
ncbi:MAG: proline racemase family protein [Firmicutes bacterium]|nr:proline racemase family protein [Bacillota bacterium]